MSFHTIQSFDLIKTFNKVLLNRFGGGSRSGRPAKAVSGRGVAGWDSQSFAEIQQSRRSCQSSRESGMQLMPVEGKRAQFAQ